MTSLGGSAHLEPRLHGLLELRAQGVSAGPHLDGGPLLGQLRRQETRYRQAVQKDPQRPGPGRRLRVCTFAFWASRSWTLRTRSSTCPHRPETCIESTAASRTLESCRRKREKIEHKRKERKGSIDEERRGRILKERKERKGKEAETRRGHIQLVCCCCCC